ncbi:MAG TPA: DMT family transporter [Candidatus Woesebacteria bacterium]|nr:DMT family transporter [Candidatus Woesebacteria bacterium]
MPKAKSRTIAYLLLILNTALWGFAVPIIKYSFQFTSPSLFLFYRYLFATLLFLPIFLIYRSRCRHPINHLGTLFVALLGTPVCLILSFNGLNLTSSVDASLIEATNPVITILLGYLFLREHITSRERKGAILALLGTLFVAIEPFITGHNHVQLSVEGNFLIILSCLIWSIFLILSKKLKLDPIFLSFYSFLISIPFFYVVNSSLGNSFLLSANALPGIFYMAVFGSIVAFWALQEGQKRIEASEAAVFGYLKPIFAIPLALIWLKESISAITVLATLIIIVGVYISEKR